MDKYPTDWKKILAHYSSHRGLVSRFYKQGKPFDRGNSNLTLRIDLKSHSPKEEMQTANKYMNKCSLLLTIKGIEATVRHFLTQNHYQQTNKPTPKLAKQMVVQREEFFCIAVRNRNQYSHYGVSQILELEPPYDPVRPLWVDIPRK